MRVTVKSITPQDDGSNDYVLNLSGVSAEIQKLGNDVKATLADGKVSVEEAVTLLGDTVLKPETAGKLMAAIYLARLFGIKV